MLDDIDEMDEDPLFDMPGGSEFQDVTDLFPEAAMEMDPDYEFFTDGFTLSDAMSAFEIGEPRMDSGMILEHQRRPLFDPLVPLLPLEVCWILERAFSCEMEWHAGNSLSQTVFTLLYAHCLGEINPDYMPRRPETTQDPLRPRELITVVLRAGVFGLLKSCDLSWREMSKGKIHEIEDWLGEKCEVSLLEGITSDFAIDKLENACSWLRNSNLSESMVTLLCDRLRLRQIILQLLKSSLPLKTTELRELLASAQHLLQKLRVQPLDPLSPNSPALLAFDPLISRRLPNFMPVRVVELPPQEKTWDAVEHILAGWEELAHLLDNPRLSTWEIAGCLRIWSPRKHIHAAYIRSLTQTSIFDRSLVLGNFPPMWLVDRFFQETIGISYDTITDKLSVGDNAPARMLMRESERIIIKLVVAYLRSHWYNPPRRRRHLMKSVLQWHELYDKFLQLASHFTSDDQANSTLVEYLAKVVLFRRLTAAREVILSGFQQDLYAPEEIPIAYWYLARVVDVHLECIEDILGFAPAACEGRDELNFQSNFLTALQFMSIAMCALTYNHSTTLPFKRISLNFVRRYKWAFKPEYDTLAPAHPLPDLLSFQPEVTEVLQDEHYSPSQSFKLAGDILRDLRNSSNEGYASRWAADRQEFIRDLVDACERLEATPANASDIAMFDDTTLKWKQRSHPWFPDFVV